jgi:enamine deaminase RidA (YjgF/YER057c/UK114 family)
MRKFVKSPAIGQAGNQSPYSAAVRDGNLIAIGGQVCLLAGIERQAGEIVERISTILHEAGAALRDLAKLVVFYRADCGVSEARLRQLLSVSLGAPRCIAITFVAVRTLTSPEAMIEIEAYALADAAGGELERRSVTLADLAPPGDSFCHGLRCGEFILVSAQAARNASGQVLCSDLPGQNRQVLANIDRILAALDVDRGDIVKANTWRLPPPDVGQYNAAAKDRFAYFAAASPAVTGITVPDVVGDGVLIGIDVWAMRQLDNSRLSRQPVQPAHHWDWSTSTPYSQGLRCGCYLFVGGQAALDQQGNVLQPDNMALQTGLTMDYIERILQQAGGGSADVIKLNTLYTAGRDVAAYRQCLKTRARYLQSGAPASTAVPVDALAYPGQTVEVEAIAILAS